MAEVRLACRFHALAARDFGLSVPGASAAGYKRSDFVQERRFDDGRCHGPFERGRAGQIAGPHARNTDPGSYAHTETTFEIQGGR